MVKANPEIETVFVEQLFYPTFIGGFAQNDIMKKYMEPVMSNGACSVRECNRVFKSNLHVTPFEYLGQLRMNKAVAMLTGTTYSITHIAETCGFSDPSHFTKAFKKIYKISPKQYRAGEKVIV